MSITLEDLNKETLIELIEKLRSNSGAEMLDNTRYEEMWERQIGTIKKLKAELKDKAGNIDIPSLKITIEELMIYAWKTASNAFRMYPDSKHTFTSVRDDLIREMNERLLLLKIDNATTEI
jgi:hypothetical protein